MRRQGATPRNEDAPATRPAPAGTWPRACGAWLAAICVGVALLASAAPASAGEIVYQHGSDLWVMNENGSNQRPLITAAQLGANSLESPSLDPTSSNLSFQGTVYSSFLCSDNCPGLYSYVGGTVLRLSPAPLDCITIVDFGCGSSDGSPNVTTVNGRVVYNHSFYIDDLLGAVAGSKNEDRALNGSGEALPWTFPSEPPTGEAGEGVDAADPLEPNTIAYASSPNCYKIETDTGCEMGIVLDQNGAAMPSYVVSYDDASQQAMAFSPNGQYIADIEVGEERGIWIYTNEDINAPGDKSTWHGWWLLEDPLQDKNSNEYEHTFTSLTVTNTGEIVFDNGVNVYELPASCWASNEGFTLTSGTVAPTCGTFGQPDSQAVQLTTDGTTNSRDEHPTWTSTTMTPYVVPGSTPPPPSGGSGGSTGPTKPTVTEPVSSVTPSSNSVVSGKPLTFKVTLTTASTIKLQILRYVPASGHGRHRHKAHYVLVETLSFAGKVGLNKLAFSTKHNGHKLAGGKYEAKISAGGGIHTVSFTIKG